MLTHNSTNTTPVAANDSNTAATKLSTLLALQRAAKDAIGSLNSMVNNLLDGQGGAGRKAVQAAYALTVACMDNPAEATKLPGWDAAAVQASANPYCQPLKMLVGDMDNTIQSRISIWAKVFRGAHDAGIPPDKFLEHLKRNHGMRKWYDAIVLAGKPVNDNGPKGGGGSSRGGAAARPPSPASVSVPIDIAQRVGDAKQITYAIIDMDMLICDSDTKADLESNPAVIGFAQVANDDCRAFLNDNDPRFGMKGAA